MRTYKQHLKSVGSGNIKTLDFDSFYDQISHDWEQRARRLQERRWQKLLNHSE